MKHVREVTRSAPMPSAHPRLGEVLDWLTAQPGDEAIIAAAELRRAYTSATSVDSEECYHLSDLAIKALFAANVSPWHASLCGGWVATPDEQNVMDETLCTCFKATIKQALAEATDG